MRFQSPDANLAHIFECGQCFRWDAEEDGSYTGIARGGHVANISLLGEDSQGGTIVIETPDAAADDQVSESEKEFWYRYLDLGRDYGEVKRKLIEGDSTGVMAKAVAYGEGIRILSQDPWEATLSFIISQNNNIPRIKKNIRDLSRAFGEKVCEWRGREWFDVPSAETLASLSEEDLAPIRLGYRARYLIETGRCVAEEGIDVIKEDPSCLCGVGPKVANCIKLFGLGQMDIFPIDVWVRKVMSELYGIDSPKEAASFAAEQFGEYGGIAQQYLFYYMRENNRK